MKFSIVTIVVIAAFVHLGKAAYQVGTGIADVTGPAAEINMASHLFYSHFSLILSPFGRRGDALSLTR